MLRFGFLSGNYDIICYFEFLKESENWNICAMQGAVSVLWGVAEKAFSTQPVLKTTGVLNLESRSTKGPAKIDEVFEIKCKISVNVYM